MAVYLFDSDDEYALKERKGGLSASRGANDPATNRLQVLLGPLAQAGEGA